MQIVLSVGQFQRFMQVIKKLGDRVEKEHDQFLRDSQRLEDRSGIASDQATNGSTAAVDFESLVGKANGATVKADTDADNNGNWDDDPWASILNSSIVSAFPCITDHVLLNLCQAATTTADFPCCPIETACPRGGITTVTTNYHDQTHELVSSEVIKFEAFSCASGYTA